MTVSIEYEAEKKLDLPYEKIIKEIVEASLDFEKCPYEAEVNVILTDNDAIQAINKEYRQIGGRCDQCLRETENVYRRSCKISYRK